MKLREKAYDSFTKRLLSRQILPGQFITQRELVDVTGMPLGAIRELIPRLEADGLLKTIPQRGMQIAHIDLVLIRNAFQLRAIIDQEAAAKFSVNASDPEIAFFRKAHEEILSEVKINITPSLIERAQAVDWEFHDAIVDHMDNRIISDIYKVNSLKIRLIRKDRTRLNRNLIEFSMNEHMRIIDAIQAHDPTAAIEAMATHINSAKSRALEV